MKLTNRTILVKWINAPVPFTLWKEAKKAAIDDQVSLQDFFVTAIRNEIERRNLTYSKLPITTLAEAQQQNT
jgi:hypothetical protein